MRTLIGLIVVISIGALMWFFFGNQVAEAPGESAGVQTTMPVPDREGVEEMMVEEMGNGAMMDDDGAMMETEVKAFIVEGGTFFFSPSSMEVKRGDTVKVTFKNTNGFHDFVVDEFKVATKQINGGQEETVEFVADKAGSFDYYCSVGNHRALGMEGTLVVSE